MLWCSRDEQRDRSWEETRYSCLIKSSGRTMVLSRKEEGGISENFYCVFMVGKKIMHLTLEAGNLNGIKRKDTKKFGKIIKYAYFTFKDL